jgi:hypothetical protein
MYASSRGKLLSQVIQYHAKELGIFGAMILFGYVVA